MEYSPKMHKLSNGVTVILDPMDAQTVAMSVSFATGARDELPHEHGLLHFCEHMMHKGTAKFPTAVDIIRHMEWYGGYRNAFTSMSRIVFVGRIVAENTNVMIDTIADQLQNSRFEPETIETERNVILDELRTTSGNSTKTMLAIGARAMFDNKTYSPSRLLGTRETIMSFTREQMLDFVARHFSARNCVIALSGKITDPDAILAQLEHAFAFLPQIDVPRNDSITYTPAIVHKTYPSDKNVQFQIVFPNVWPVKWETHLQRTSVTKFKIYLHDAIIKSLRYDNGLVYGTEVYEWGNTKVPATSLGASVSPENIGRVVALMAQTASHVYNDSPFTDVDLERMTRRAMLGDADLLENPAKRADKLADYYLDFNHVFDLPGAVKLSQSVTRDDVIKYSRGYFDGGMSIISMGHDFPDDLAAIWNENFKRGTCR